LPVAEARGGTGLSEERFSPEEGETPKCDCVGLYSTSGIPCAVFVVVKSALVRDFSAGWSTGMFAGEAGVEGKGV
jgi:hypothetical protein